MLKSYDKLFWFCSSFEIYLTLVWNFVVARLNDSKYWPNWVLFHLLLTGKPNQEIFQAWNKFSQFWSGLNLVCGSGWSTLDKNYIPRIKMFRMKRRLSFWIQLNWTISTSVERTWLKRSSSLLFYFFYFTNLPSVLYGYRTPMIPLQAN